MHYFNWKLSINTCIPHCFLLVYYRSRQVSVKGLHNTLLWKMIHQIHKNKALTDEALTYMVTSINCYIKMKLSFKQASDPIHFKHKSLRGAGGVS